MPYLVPMIEQLSDEIKNYARDLAEADIRLKPKYRELIACLEESRSQYIAEYSALENELKAIKADDPEVYEMIYWHDLKRKNWRQVFDITCSGLMCDYPEVFCKKIVFRYLEKHGYNR
ncbi:MAG: hypothetical protein E7194_00065 [Erysipelotrichaceae bacterium]|nr:hypothetical protein [Erysipelotrichaceae bacterium]